jgi:hypothetical protein
MPRTGDELSDVAGPKLAGVDEGQRAWLPEVIAPPPPRHGRTVRRVDRICRISTSPAYAPAAQIAGRSPAIAREHDWNNLHVCRHNSVRCRSARPARSPRQEHTKIPSGGAVYSRAGDSSVPVSQRANVAQRGSPAALTLSAFATYERWTLCAMTPRSYRGSRSWNWWSGIRGFFAHDTDPMHARASKQ